jgi:hypothetical protein
MGEGGPTPARDGDDGRSAAHGPHGRASGGGIARGVPGLSAGGPAVGLGLSRGISGVAGGGAADGLDTWTGMDASTGARGVSTGCPRGETRVSTSVHGEMGRKTGARGRRARGRQAGTLSNGSRGLSGRQERPSGGRRSPSSGGLVVSDAGGRGCSAGVDSTPTGVRASRAARGGCWAISPRTGCRSAAMGSGASCLAGPPADVISRGGAFGAAERTPRRSASRGGEARTVELEFRVARAVRQANGAPDPFDKGAAPFDKGAAPFDTGGEPFDMGVAPFDTDRERPTRVGTPDKEIRPRRGEVEEPLRRGRQERRVPTPGATPRRGR